MFEFFMSFLMVCGMVCAVAITFFVAGSIFYFLFDNVMFLFKRNHSDDKENK